MNPWYLYRLKILVGLTYVIQKIMKKIQDLICKKIIKIKKN